MRGTLTGQWWVKFLVLMACVTLALVYVYPTLSKLDPEKSKFPFKQKINLGLDLQGGLYMVLGVDFEKVYRDVVSRQTISMAETLKDFSGVKSVKGLEESASEDPRILIEFEPSKRDAVREKIRKDYEWAFRLADEAPGKFQMGLTVEYRNEIREKTMAQSIEVIRNRIDEFGVSEPSITTQGSDRVVVELPGVKDVDRAKQLIGQTAKLEFRIVNTKVSEAQDLQGLVAKIEKDHGITFKPGQRFSEYTRLINEKAKGQIPEDSEIAFERIRPQVGDDVKVQENELMRRPYLLFKRVDVTGDDLQDAQVSFEQETRKPSVAFSLNPKGAQAFDKLTGEHVGDFLAIVLDGIVHSAPRINSRIGGGNGQITLGAGNYDQTLREARDLAIVLRAGALPAQLEFLEQRVVGPSLGEDSIRKGGRAALIGSALAMLFVLFYYKVSGVIAVLSLLLNVLFVLACLVGLEATLTLPGIAGIALTVGMAVDSNIIIFERIRDELRAGKSILGSIEAGFEKAFSAILDSNLTSAAAAIVLLIYGTGPIRGFAVTMLIGIVTTIFTAVFVARVLFDLYYSRIEARNGKTLSI
jgi:protein-export membrane protein SecD